MLNPLCTMEIITESYVLVQIYPLVLIVDRHELRPRDYMEGTNSKLNPFAHPP